MPHVRRGIWFSGGERSWVSSLDGQARQLGGDVRGWASVTIRQAVPALNVRVGFVQASACHGSGQPGVCVTEKLISVNLDGTDHATRINVGDPRGHQAMVSRVSGRVIRAPDGSRSVDVATG